MSTGTMNFRNKNKPEAAKPVEKPRFMPPPVRLGDSVYWHPAGVVNEQQPLIAQVTNVGALTLALSIVHKDAMSLYPKDGVPHVDDPRLAGEDARENGAWSYTPQTAEFYEMKQAIGELQDVAADMKAQLDTLQAAVVALKPKS